MTPSTLAVVLSVCAAAIAAGLFLWHLASRWRVRRDLDLLLSHDWRVRQFDDTELHSGARLIEFAPGGIDRRRR